MGYAWSVKWAWRTSTTPGTAGRQAATSCFGGMQRTYKTERPGGRQSRGMRTDQTVVPAATATAAPAAGGAPVRFDTKIAVLLREDLEPWQRLNVTAFLV